MCIHSKNIGILVLVTLLVLGVVAIVLKQRGILEFPWAWTLSPFWFILILWLAALVITNFYGDDRDQ